MRAAVVLLLVSQAAMAVDYLAPGGSTTARVVAASPTSCESIVEISSGSVNLGRQSYVSDDHDNGSCVAHASWTPDGKFFAFSLQNSGGHQPWNSVITVFSIEKKRFIDIDPGSQEAITDPAFTLSAPSRIDFEVTAIPLDGNRPLRRKIDLKSLLFLDMPIGH